MLFHIAIFFKITHIFQNHFQNYLVIFHNLWYLGQSGIWKTKIDFNVEYFEPFNNTSVLEHLEEIYQGTVYLNQWLELLRAFRKGCI